MSTPLRRAVIRLASENPSLREDLLPILQQTSKAAARPLPSLMMRTAGAKTAAGPDSTGRNWKMLSNGLTRWVWIGKGADPSFTVFGTQERIGPVYTLQVLLEDGTILKAYGLTSKEHWFKRAAQIYKEAMSLSLDFSKQPEQWRRVAKSKDLLPVKGKVASEVEWTLSTGKGLKTFRSLEKLFDHQSEYQGSFATIHWFSDVVGDDLSLDVDDFDFDGTEDQLRLLVRMVKRQVDISR